MTDVTRGAAGNNGSSEKFHAAWAWILHNSVWLWPALAGLAYIVFIVRPFSPPLPQDRNVDIAKTWNASLGRLGISPVYPPQEDFFVGDLWAVVVNATDPWFQGKAVRVGHVDLSAAIKSEYGGRVSIANLPRTDSNVSDIPDTIDVVPHLFSLSFPGISIARSDSNAGNSPLPFLSLSASRTNEEAEEISIPFARTYGADIVEAMLSFYAYCAAPETQVRCTEKFARNLLAATLDTRIAEGGKKSESSGEQKTFDIRLQLITRVFLTQAIRQRLHVSSGESAALETDQDPGAGRGDDGGAKPKVADYRASTVQDLASSGEPFERPLVFGFRSAMFMTTGREN